MLVPFPAGCKLGTLQRRVKRFSVECLSDGVSVWAHTNNSGSMLGLIRKGAAVWLSPASNPGRKLPYTLELVGQKDAGGSLLWVGVNTLTPNRLLRAAFAAGKLPWARGYTSLQPEAARGDSRLDALLTGQGLPPLWVECKNVTMVEDGGVAAFPDAVTLRGQKHVRAMMDIVAAGERAAFFYCVQRSDAVCFAPADYVDAAYAGLFYAARRAGVETYVHHAPVSLQGIDIGSVLPLAPCA